MVLCNRRQDLCVSGQIETGGHQIQRSRRVRSEDDLGTACTEETCDFCPRPFKGIGRFLRQSMSSPVNVPANVAVKRSLCIDDFLRSQGCRSVVEIY